ncbi:hypothetical protein OG389_00625 [Streptomyces sp. NBC_00435]|uniref:hypothetical protein n=1 Tax=Streptomyces sp. NBC_00435 TaxID=2903649 RepID=UPI002E1A65A3
MRGTAVPAIPTADFFDHGRPLDGTAAIPARRKAAASMRSASAPNVQLQPDHDQSRDPTVHYLPTKQATKKAASGKIRSA